MMAPVGGFSAANPRRLQWLSRGSGRREDVAARIRAAFRRSRAIPNIRVSISRTLQSSDPPPPPPLPGLPGEPEPPPPLLLLAATVTDTVVLAEARPCLSRTEYVNASAPE